MHLDINGRYTLTPETGVQRYARCIVNRIICVNQIVPCGLWTSNKISANVWEQLILPIKIRYGGFLWSPANVAPLLGGRQIMTIHDAAPLTGRGWFGHKFTLWYCFAWRWLVLSGVNLVTVSNFSRKELSYYLGVPIRSIGVIPNGGDHVLSFQPQRPRNMDAFPFVLIVGSVQPRKNISIVADAWAMLPDNNFNLVVVGGGDGIFARSELKKSKSSKISFLGRVDDNELAWLYNNARILVAPSLYEGFDIPPMEALNLGCPILISDIPVHREVFGESALYFKPQDATELARLLNAELLLPQRRELSKAAQKIITKFTWANAAQQAERLMASWMEFEQGVVV